MIAFASVFVVLGVACKRAWLLFTSFITPNIVGAPGIAGGSAAARDGGDLWALVGTYAPTVPEILIVLGVISVGALVFMVLCNKLLMGNDIAFQTADEAARAI